MQIESLFEVLQPMDKEAFVKIVTADQPDAPAYFAYDAVLNSKQRQTLDKAMKQTLKPLSLEAVLELRSAAVHAHLTHQTCDTFSTDALTISDEIIMNPGAPVVLPARCMERPNFQAKFFSTTRTRRWLSVLPGMQTRS